MSIQLSKIVISSVICLLLPMAYAGSRDVGPVPHDQIMELSEMQEIELGLARAVVDSNLVLGNCRIQALSAFPGQNGSNDSEDHDFLSLMIGIKADAYSTVMVLNYKRDNNRYKKIILDQDADVIEFSNTWYSRRYSSISGSSYDRESNLIQFRISTGEVLKIEQQKWFGLKSEDYRDATTVFNSCAN